VRSKTDGLQHRNQVAQSAARFERIRLLIAGAELGVVRRSVSFDRRSFMMS